MDDGAIGSGMLPRADHAVANRCRTARVRLSSGCGLWRAA